MADLSLLSGFAKGFAQTKLDSAERERRKEAWEIDKMNKKLQQQTLSMQQQLLKMKQAREDREWALKEKILQRFEQGEQEAKQPKEQEEPKFGESFEGGLTDELAGYGIDPVTAGILGGEIQDIYENQYKERDYSRKLGQDEWSRTKDLMSGEWIETEGPQGKFKTRVPKYPGLGAGGVPGSFQSGMPPIKLKKRTDPKDGVTYEVPVNENTGEEVGQRMPVEPLKGESAEASAKIALANQGLGHVEAITSKFINSDGSVNRDLVILSNAPGGGFGEGRQIRATFLDALDARARAATGAAMPDSEVANYTRMYFPSYLDNDATIKDKLKRLKGFLKDYMEALDPSGLQRKRLNKKADFVYDPSTGKLEPVK